MITLDVDTEADIRSDIDVLSPESKDSRLKAVALALAKFHGSGVEQVRAGNVELGLNLQKIANSIAIEVNRIETEPVAWQRMARD